MKKRKVIHPKNLPVQINILSVVVTFWFLWEHLIREWERTLLIVLYSVLIVAFIIGVVSEEKVDVLNKEEK